MFLLVIALSDAFIAANELRRYVSSSARVFAGSGPPFSQLAGGVLALSSAANAKFAQATCLTWSANDRNCVGPTAAGALLAAAGTTGRKLYFSSGIASAAARNSYS